MMKKPEQGDIQQPLLDDEGNLYFFTDILDSAQYRQKKSFKKVDTGQESLNSPVKEGLLKQHPKQQDAYNLDISDLNNNPVQLGHKLQHDE